jgi:hypothetical protein
MWVDIVINTLFFLLATMLAYLASKVHINYLKASARNAGYVQRAEMIGRIMEGHKEELKINRQTFERTFAQVPILCPSDMSKICNGQCADCVKRRGGAK